MAPTDSSIEARFGIVGHLMKRVSPRLAAISESATMAITNQAAQMKAAGEDVISFGAGEPDFPTPGHIVEAARQAASDPRNHKYTANSGLPDLREAIAAFTADNGGPQVRGADVLVTNGGKQGVYQSFAALLDRGDEAIVPAPYWVTYPEAIKLAGGVPVEVPTTSEAGFKVTVDQLEEARTDRTKLLVFVSPSNPTGAVYTPEETRAIGLWAAQHDVWIVTDEIYQHLTYAPTTFTSIVTVTPELEDRWVIVSGVAKTFAMTGWRLGWMIGPGDVIKAASNLQSHLTSNVSNVSQRAALAALTGPLEPMWAMRDAFDRRRRTMHRMLSDIPGVTCVEPQGAFYCFPDLTGLIGVEFPDDLAIAAHLLERAKVAIVPGEAFGTANHARLSYALSDEDLERGLVRMRSVLV